MYELSDFVWSRNNPYHVFTVHRDRREFDSTVRKGRDCLRVFVMVD